MITHHNQECPVIQALSKLLDKLGLGSKDEGVPAKEPSADELKELREKYEKAGREQVFAFYDICGYTRIMAYGMQSGGMEMWRCLFVAGPTQIGWVMLTIEGGRLATALH